MRIDMSIDTYADTCLEMCNPLFAATVRLVSAVLAVAVAGCRRVGQTFPGAAISVIDGREFLGIDGRHLRDRMAAL